MEIFFMIDVSHKITTLRSAKAEGVFWAQPESIERIRNRTVPKGEVLEIARAAGIAAAKRTADWIIFCHPIPLDWVGISFEIGIDQIKVVAEVRTVWKTGVEMEAITAVSAALLNMYDMLKPLDDNLSLGAIRVIEKKGGKSDFTAEFSRPLLWSKETGS
jgi:cyclic pyranopterin phosphate synthase